MPESGLFEEGDKNRDELVRFLFERGETGGRHDTVGFKALEPEMRFIGLTKAIAEPRTIFGF